MYTHTYITHTCYIFLFHSSVDGHLVCFHILAIINSVAVNIEVYVSFQAMFLSGYICPRVGLMVALLLVF